MVSFFSEADSQLMLGQELPKDHSNNPKLNHGFKVVGNQNSQQSLVLTKFDLLEAFTGHGDLVNFLQEQICCRKRVQNVKSMLLETADIVREKQQSDAKKQKLQELRERKQ